MEIINPQIKELERKHEELRNTVFQMRGEINAIKLTTSDNTRQTIWQFVAFSVTMAAILIAGIKYQSDVLRNEMDIRFGAMEKRMEQSETNFNARLEDFKQEIRSEIRELKEEIRASRKR